jgi:integrase
MWYRYVGLPDGGERRQQREKIITRELAESHHIATDYSGPLTKADAQRVLDLLIAQDAGTYVPPNTQATVATIAREYLALAQPNWGVHMVRAAGNLIEKHIIAGKLGNRPIVDVTETDLQGWINDFVNAGASRSLLKGLLLHTRAIWKRAHKQQIVLRNPTTDLRAKSKQPVCERYLSVDECQQLLSALYGRDHLIVRMFIQLGLRPEELFALRRDDVQGDQLRIDEALVVGRSSSVKTPASNGFVYIPPEVNIELTSWMQNHPGQSRDWLFQTFHGRPGCLNLNNYRNRILQPAAIRAKVGVSETTDEKGKSALKTDVDFRCLRRTCATLFGSASKDAKSLQHQLRHADPNISLGIYQKSIPRDVKVAADAFERSLGFGLPTDFQGN